MGYRIFAIVLFSSILLIPAAFTQTLAEEYFPNKETEVIKPPTYCVIIPPDSEIDLNISGEYALRISDAVNLWSQKLIAEEPKNKKNWLMTTIILTESYFEKNQDLCDIPVIIQFDASETNGKYCPSNSHLNYEHICGLPIKENSPWMTFKVSNIGFSTDYFFGIALHEVGHSLGLGHNLDDEHIARYVDSISSLVIRPVLTTISQEDIDTVRSVFGEKGFFAFVLVTIEEDCRGIITCRTVLAEPGKPVSWTGYGYIPEEKYTKGIPAEVIIQAPDQTFQKMILPVEHSFTKPFTYTLDFPSENEHGVYKITEYYKNQRMYTTILTVDTQTDPQWIGISDYCRFLKEAYNNEIDCHAMDAKNKWTPSLWENSSQR